MTVRSDMMKEMHILFRQRLYEEMQILKPDQIEYLIQSYGQPFDVPSEKLDWYANAMEDFERKNIEEAET